MSKRQGLKRIGTPRSLKGGIRRMEAAASDGGKWGWVYESFAAHLQRELSRRLYATEIERLTNEAWLWRILGWMSCPEVRGAERYRAVLGVGLLLRVLRIGRTN